MGAHPPRYDLAAAQACPAPQIGNSCARKAEALLQWDNPQRVRSHIAKLFQCLTANDFCHVEPMRDKGGPIFDGDVYGKRDSHGLWFMKITYDVATNTTIMSCHEAEHDMRLADGRTLRKKQP